MKTEKEPEMMNGRFTAIEGVPGIWLQHISSMQDGTASLQTLRLCLHWETDVTGQGLRDVVHAVHLQIGLIWKKKQRRDIKLESAEKRKILYLISFFMLLTMDKFDI